MAAKFCKVLTYSELKPLMKWHDSDLLITRGQVSNLKLNISSSTRPIYLAGWCRMVTGIHPWSHMAL